MSTIDWIIKVLNQLPTTSNFQSQSKPQSKGCWLDSGKPEIRDAEVEPLRLSQLGGALGITKTCPKTQFLRLNQAIPSKISGATSPLHACL